MKDHLVVGYDGNPGGTDALALSFALADAPGAGTDVGLVVASIHPLPQPGRRGAAPGYEDAVREAAADRLAPAREACGLRPGTAFVVRAGTSPAHGLHQVAREFDASTIVVGRTHRGPIGSALLGGATEQTLHGAPCAVAVAPAGFAGRTRRPLHRIGVAVDGGPESQRALGTASALARRSDAELVLVRVLEPYPLWFGVPFEPYPIADLRADAEREAAEALERAGRADAEVRIANGPTGPALADQTDLDLLVVGSRGFGPLGRVLLGSTASHLARHATVPLLVVPRSAQAEPGARAAAD
jgi:nucleotide-binding universal stress UspA family protein